MQVDGLIFDKDGTLFHFGATWESWAAAFLRRISGGAMDRAVALGQMIGFDTENQKFRRDSVVIAGTAQEVAECLKPGLPEMSHSQIVAVMDEEAATAPQAEAVPLKPYLTGLRRAGLKLGVATNDSEVPARAHLQAAGVTELFDFIAGFDSGFGGKPAPGQLLGFADQTGLDPARVAMVGDSLHDLAAGRAAGMRTIAVLTGMAMAEELRPMADLVLPDIGHIPAEIGLI